MFDKICATHGIEHRLIKPRHPQANGMVERFNGRIEDILNQTLLKYGSIRYLWHRLAIGRLLILSCTFNQLGAF
uniref:integrase core domain-containing protein n=1 Tax=Desulfogranum mediterraneum TaxID=160661 RepID=UPI0012947373